MNKNIDCSTYRFNIEYMTTKKRILIVSRAFFPMIAPRSFRATELAKEFSFQGYEVTVLTHIQDYNYSEFSKKFCIKIEDFAKGRWKELKPKNIFIKILQFLLKYFFLFPDIQLTRLVKRALKNRSGYDILISNAVPYPVHWGVVLAKKKNPNLTKVWISDCGDTFLGYGHNHGKPFYFRFIDNWFMNNAEIITLPYKELIKYFKKKYHYKIKFIPQGFNFEEIKLSEYKKNRVPTFAYAGIFITNFRDPRLFLKYLSSIKSDFKFIIYTKGNELLAEYEQVLKEKIEIRKYIPRLDLINELSKMDFLINIQNGNKKDYPSKLIDYTLSQRPVLNINSFTLNEKGIQEFFNGKYENYNIALKDVDKYNIKNVAKQFLDLSK